MPPALPRACSGGCGNVVTGKGLCPACARARERRRGTATQRGYDHHWMKFRRRFKEMLIRAGVAPVCGAALPGGPAMAHSRCKAEGRLVDRNPDGSDLHLDHDPPLTAAERRDWRKVCDPYRVGFLCAVDHAAKTREEQQRVVV